MPHFWRTSSLSSIFAFVSSAWADYHIDDTNTTLTYSSGPKAAWAPYAANGETLELLLPNGTYQVIDAYVCWNQTYRYAACFDTDSCLLTIPFTGSGITVFVYQAGPVGINASISIDGAYAQTNVLSAPPAPAYQIANVSMFDVQQLPSGPHSLGLLVNDLSGSYSGMMFDYAYVNESLVANSTTTTSATASSTSTASTSAPAPSSSGSHTNTGAIIGGAIAGVSLVVAGIFAFLWIRRRRGHVPEMISLHSASASPPFNPASAYDPPFSTTAQMYDPFAGYNLPTSNSGGYSHTPSQSAELSSNMPLVPNRLISSDAPRAPSSHSQDIVTPFTVAPSVNNSNSSGAYSHKTQLTVSNNTAANPSPQPQTGQSPPVSQQDIPSLTDEQADFINSLHQNNVPAAAIARVVERMLVDRHAGIREWERETRLARTNSMTTAPPSYDLIAERGQL